MENASNVDRTDYDASIQADTDKVDQERKDAEVAAGEKKDDVSEVKDDVSGEKKEDIVEKTPEQIEADKIEEDKLKAEVETEKAIEKAKTEGKKEEKKIAEAEKKEETVKQWYDEEEPKVALDSNETTKPDKDNSEKVLAYDKLMEDKEIKAFIEAKKAGKNLHSFLSEIKGVDPNLLTTEELHKIDLKNYGLSSEAIEERMEKFENLDPYEKARETNHVKDNLIKEQNERLNKFSTDSAAEAEKVTVRNDKIVNKAKTDIDKMMEDIKDKEFCGVKMTPEIIEVLRKNVTSELTLYNSDGTFNIPYMTELSMFTKFRKKMMEDNIEAAISRTEKKIFNENARVSKNDKGLQRSPDLNRKNKSMESAEAEARKYNPIYSENNS